MAQLRVYRLLCIEGEEAWVTQTLAKRVAAKTAPYVVPAGGKITEIEMYEDIQFRLSQDPNTRVLDLHDLLKKW